MTNYAHGHEAEQFAAEHLEHLGYEILELNYRTRWCEIDIVARKDGIVSFVEVKYRQSAGQGGGLDYITPAKLRQMRFAAENWAAEHDFDGVWQLAALEVSGADFAVTDFIESITA